MESTTNTQRQGVGKDSAQGPALRIGVSACLLGENVRWDGGHKRDRFVTDVLASFVEYVRVCPEVGSGLPTPRDTLRLVGDPSAPRLMQPKTGLDHTAAMQRFSGAEVERLSSLELCGFILKKDSPSCGMQRVRVYHPSGTAAVREGEGVFARALREALPLLPIEEEGRLNDPVLRETFVERIFAYRRLRDLMRAGLTASRLMDFHRIHKYLLMAHSPEHYRTLGPVVANSSGVAPELLYHQYGVPFMEAIACRANAGRHYNVLQHMAGYFKDQLSADQKLELHGVLDDYRARLVPLIVPITLVRHHVRSLGIDYLADQIYLSASAKELMLRNHV